jgi:SNF2 family DNA or RNA helicase
MAGFGMKSKNERIRPASYQLVPLTKLLTNELCAILICDGVGVGKTISAGYAILYMLSRWGKPCAVVCPPALLSKWMFELKSKFQLEALPVRSREDLETAKEETQYSARTPNVYVVTNSILLGAKAEDYPEISLIVFDEIHNYRNNETKAHQGAMEVAKVAAWRVGLSATPINNSLDDLVSEVSLLVPNYSWETIQATIGDLWTTDRVKLTNALVTRFLKDRLGIHFAARKVLWKESIYPAEYAAKVRAIVGKVRTSRRAFDSITYYRLAASSPEAFAKAFGIKQPMVSNDPKLDILRQILRDQTIEHWLVFCEFRETVEYISNKVSERVLLTMTGETPMFERESILDTFSKTPNSALVMTSVGSEGLDMQFSQGIINYDLHWNPMKLEQRIGRIDRVGQKKDWIQIVNILVQGSIDERVLSVINRKLETISGSIFAADGIVRSKPSAEQQLYDSAAISEEISEGERLIRTFDQNNPITNNDYECLPNLEVGYCLPQMMRQAGQNAELPWIEQSDAGRVWLNTVKKDGHEIQTLLDYFS